MVVSTVKIYMHMDFADFCDQGAWSTASEAIGTCNANLKVVESSDFLSVNRCLYISSKSEVSVLLDLQDDGRLGQYSIGYRLWIRNFRLPTPTRPFDWLIKSDEIAENLSSRENGYAKFTKGAAYVVG